MASPGSTTVLGSSEQGKISTSDAIEPLERCEMVLFPWSAAVCAAWSVLTTVTMAVAVYLHGINPRWTEPDPLVVWHSRSGVLLICSAVVMELCVLTSSWMAACMVDQSWTPHLRLQGLGDSILTLFEYACKLATALYIVYAKGGIRHADNLAWGGTRPVYLCRFVQWAIAIPILVLLTNRAFLAHKGQVWIALRSGPALIVSFLYCMATWLMVVTPDQTFRWTLFFMSMMGFVFASLDQICLAHQAGKVTAQRLKVALLTYQLVTFTFYAVLCMFGRWGIVDAITEQCVYAYSDATVKIFSGSLLAMIRNFEDLRTIGHWWKEAVTSKMDFQRLVRQAKVPIIGISVDGCITSWNESLVKLTGLPAARVLGHPAVEFLSKESQVTFQDAFCRTMSDDLHSSGLVELLLCHKADEGAIVSGSAKAKNPEVKAVHLLVNFVLKYSQDGKIDGVVAIGQDLSELSELKAVEHKKAQLMAVVSHELRSPLHGIIGLTNMMAQSEEAEVFRRQLLMVRSCAGRLLDLVTNVMDLTEAEKRRQADAPAAKPSTPVDFHSIVEEVVVMTTLAMDKAGKPLVSGNVSLVNATDEVEELPIVLGDPYKCTQMLYNLVTNACKFTKQGTVRIELEHFPERHILEVRVKDTGVGIPEEAKDRIFAPFEQEHSAGGDARSFQGMGLGLSVVSEIVRFHGGSVRVESMVGVGSAFILSLPCTDQMAKKVREGVSLSTELNQRKERNAAQSIESEKGVASQECRRPCVLSVDDDDVNQEVVKNALGQDHDVVTAMDGTEALQKLQEWRHIRQTEMPDIILLDIQMPGLTGYEVLNQIREKYSAAHTELPVIMVSAKGPSETAAIESYRTGCTDFLAKPFNTSLLRAKVAVSLMNKEDAPKVGAQARLAKAADAAAREAQAALERAAALEERELAWQKEREQLIERTKTHQEELQAAREQAADVRKQLSEHLRGEHEELEAARERAASLEQELTQYKQAEVEGAPAKEADLERSLNLLTGTYQVELQAAHEQVARLQQLLLEKEAAQQDHLCTANDKVARLERQLAEQMRVQQGSASAEKADSPGQRLAQQISSCSRSSERTADLRHPIGHFDYRAASLEQDHARFRQEFAVARGPVQNVPTSSVVSKFKALAATVPMATVRELCAKLEGRSEVDGSQPPSLPMPGLRPCVLSMGGTERSQDALQVALSHFNLVRTGDAQEALAFLARCRSSNQALPDVILVDAASQQLCLIEHDVLVEVRRLYTEAREDMPVLVVVPAVQPSQTTTTGLSDPNHETSDLEILCTMRNHPLLERLMEVRDNAERLREKAAMVYKQAMTQSEQAEVAHSKVRQPESMQGCKGSVARAGMPAPEPASCVSSGQAKKSELNVTHGGSALTPAGADLPQELDPQLDPHGCFRWLYRQILDRDAAIAHLRQDLRQFHGTGHVISGQLEAMASILERSKTALASYRVSSNQRFSLCD